jgi:A/G-specific adenine glycosylase
LTPVPQKLTKIALRSLLNWSKKNSRNFPWRRSSDPYRILIAELLLRRTTATAVNRCYRSLLDEFPSVQQLSHADEGTLSGLLRPLGLRKRSHSIREVASEIVDRFGEVPSKYEDLLSIKWIGEYTSAAVLCMSKNEPYPMVDGGVRRVMGRYFYDREIPLERARAILRQALTRSNCRRLNFGFIDLSAKVCTPMREKCDLCPLAKRCSHGKKKLGAKQIS